MDKGRGGGAGARGDALPIWLPSPSRPSFPRWRLAPRPLLLSPARGRRRDRGGRRGGGGQGCRPTLGSEATSRPPVAPPLCPPLPLGRPPFAAAKAGATQYGAARGGRGQGGANRRPTGQGKVGAGDGGRSASGAATLPPPTPRAAPFRLPSRAHDSAASHLDALAHLFKPHLVGRRQRRRRLRPGSQGRAAGGEAGGGGQGAGHGGGPHGEWG